MEARQARAGGQSNEPKLVDREKNFGERTARRDRNRGPIGAAVRTGTL